MEKKKKQQYQLISLTNVFTCYIERVNSLKSDCKANRGLMMMMKKKLCHIHISRETLLLWECAIVGSRLFGVARNYTLAAIFLYTHTEQQMAKQTNLLFFPHTICCTISNIWIELIRRIGTMFYIWFHVGIKHKPNC